MSAYKVFGFESYDWEDEPSDMRDDEIAANYIESIGTNGDARKKREKKNKVDDFESLLCCSDEDSIDLVDSMDAVIHYNNATDEERKKIDLLEENEEIQVDILELRDDIDELKKNAALKISTLLNRIDVLKNKLENNEARRLELTKS